MTWFNKRKKEDVGSVQLTPAKDSRVEIELHKTASQESKDIADQVNKHVKDLLRDNGFTVKIYVAAGGHLPVKGKSK